MEDAKRIAKKANELQNEQDKIHAQSVFDLITRMNKRQEWMKEVSSMGAFRDLFKEEFEEKDKKINELNEQLQNQSEQLQNQSEQLKKEQAENSRLREELEQLKKQVSRIAMF